MTSSRPEPECACTSVRPAAEGLQQEPRVERGDGERDAIREHLDRRRIHKLAHLGAVGREKHEGEDRERKLEAENDLE